MNRYSHVRILQRGHTLAHETRFVKGRSYAEVMADPSPIDDQLREELTELTASLCKAVNDPKRLMLLLVLGDGPRAVGELADAIDASQANVSQHLAILREQGVVDTERQGSSVIYSLRHPELLDAIAIMREVQAKEARRRAQLFN